MSSPKFKEHKTVHDVVALILSTMSWHLSNNDYAGKINQKAEMKLNRFYNLIIRNAARVNATALSYL